MLAGKYLSRRTSWLSTCQEETWTTFK